MSFKKGDKVKVISVNSMHEGKTGTVTKVYEDLQSLLVRIHEDNLAGMTTGFFPSELELVDEKREALIELAETLDSARKQANAINGADGTIYQSITTPLISVLDSLVPVDATGYDAYEFIIEDGLSVREALRKVEK